MAGERTLNLAPEGETPAYRIQDNDPNGGDLIIEHVPSGNTFEYDASEGALIPTAPIGTANRKASAITTTSVNTDELSTTPQSPVKYFPAERVDRATEVNTTSPPTSYGDANAVLSLSEPPSDATIVLLEVLCSGDGTSGQMTIEIRENGTTRQADAQLSDWAGHGAITIEENPIPCPMNSSNEIQYRTTNISEVFLSTVGYY